MKLLIGIVVAVVVIVGGFWYAHRSAEHAMMEKTPEVMMEHGTLSPSPSPSDVMMKHSGQ